MALAVFSVGLDACISVKPENLVRLGMSVQQVEALIGPSRGGMWRYESADGAVQIDFTESGAYDFIRIQRDEAGQTVEAWSSDGTPVQARFTRDPNGLLKKEWEHAVPPSSLPIVYQDSPAKVLKLYGQAPYMELHFAFPLKWFTTPPVPIVQQQGSPYRAMGWSALRAN